ncbi:Peptidase [Elusimicrobium minutum Pei191]|uniref:Peptidase T n=1 Tax=Elusimicrobium minutum (strain Pei191) TaxID=445932 RepID=B2KCG3_ELUMP|nr:peptidase T [Elusimicrobium minutum]ACC98084.1 Peptidase [Elusimicrobium minutum Pei191]
MDFKQNILEKFLRYVKTETTSDTESSSKPSTKTQLEFAAVLAKEMETLGIKDIKISKTGHLTGSIPANNDAKAPTIGFIAHIDTSPDFNGKNVNPQIHKNYAGGAIVINKDKNMSISPEMDKILNDVTGHDIITTDGNSLLGADDKAGIAIIMTMAQYLKNNPSFKHGPVKIAFTPDEEIGTGILDFDVADFKADFAYTVDGSVMGEIENGNFNADKFKIEITGVNCHPGTAKDVMVNPVRVAADLINRWPESKLPETTEGEEGFILFNTLKGNIEKTEIGGIIREHDLKKLTDLEDSLKKIIEDTKAKFKGAQIKLTISEQYRNMKDVLAKNPEAMNKLLSALEDMGIKYKISQIRGGTDGARLSFMGLPTPNIFAGYSQPHGPYEWASLDAMAIACKFILKIVEVK